MGVVTTDRVHRRQRIEELVNFLKSSDKKSNIGAEIESHLTKHVCILISGHIEQSLKEIILEYADIESPPWVLRYIDKSWARSRNMKSAVIIGILNSFNDDWGTLFDKWIMANDRKKELNEAIEWRNTISHGKESDVSNITIKSAMTKFQLSCDFVNFIEKLVHNELTKRE